MFLSFHLTKYDFFVIIDNVLRDDIMNENDVKYFISILKMPQCEEVDNYDIEKHYDILIRCLNKLLKSNINILNYEGANIILDKTIKKIWNKITCLEQLSQEESEVFLYTLYYETQKELKIDNAKINNMEFVEIENFIPGIKRYGLHTIHSDRTESIKYNKELLEKFSSNSPKSTEKEYIMLIICHELIHSRQTQDIFSNKISLNTFILLLEKVTRKQVKEYAKKNYPFTRIETDADVKAVQYLYNFINKHKLYGDKQLKEISNILSKFETDQLNVSANYQTTYNGIKDISGKNLIRACSEYIAKNPAVLEEYPLLSISYHQDGRIKTPKELLIEREKRKISNYQDMDELDKIYEYIIDFHFNKYQEPYNKEDIVRKQELYKFKELLEYIDTKEKLDKFELKIIRNIALRQSYSQDIIEEYINRKSR